MDKKVSYYYVVFSKESLLSNLVLEEVLRERVNFYISQGKKQNFWILNSATFLENELIINKIKKTNYYKLNKSLFENNLFSSNLSTLISCDKEFIKWLKLRCGYFEEIDDITEEITSNYTSDGFSGRFIVHSASLFNPLAEFNTVINKFTFQKLEKISKLISS